jgi:hypothetical protein
MEITLEEIQNRFDSLPENLKWAIMEAEIDDKITEIGKDHGLTVEQIGQLSLETHMVVLNYTRPEKFEESIKGSLQLSDEKIHNIAIEVNNKILKKIRENLMSSSETKEEYETVPEVEEKQVVEKPKDENLLINDQQEKEKEIENKKIMESISSQKLSGSFQIPVIKTEYSLNNISKDKEKVTARSEQIIKTPLEATIKPTTGEIESTSPSYKIGEDPYRISPE